MIEYDADAEAFIIGCLVTDSECIDKVTSVVTDSDFHSPLCKKVYQKLKKLHAQGIIPDFINVCENLSKANRATILTYSRNVPTTCNVLQYCHLVKDTARKLKAQTLAYELVETTSREASIEELQNLAIKVSEALNNTEYESSLSAQDGYLLFHETKQKPKTYISTGLFRVDKYIYIDKGDYIVIGGRPSSGKTAFTLQMMLHMAKEHNVTYFSLETSAVKVFDRLIANYTKTKLSDIKQNSIGEQWQKIAESGEGFAKLRFNVVEAAGWTVEQIRAKAIQLQSEVIFVDYIGLIKGDGKSLYERVTNISNDLHIMAQQSKIAVIALSQLNRDGKGEPDMTHLRESGAIEQDADAVLLLHKVAEDKPYERKLIIAKNKEGEVGSMMLSFQGEYQKFSEFETRY